MTDLLFVTVPMLLILTWLLFCAHRSRRPDPPPVRTDPVRETRALYEAALPYAPAGRHRKTDPEVG